VGQIKLPKWAKSQYRNQLVIIAHALLFKDGLIIVEAAD
jgi:hypothetical protein